MLGSVFAYGLCIQLGSQNVRRLPVAKKIVNLGKEGSRPGWNGAAREKRNYHGARPQCRLSGEAAKNIYVINVYIPGLILSAMSHTTATFFFFLF